jgi:hypothetical protein
MPPHAGQCRNSIGLIVESRKMKQMTAKLMNWFLARMNMSVFAGGRSRSDIVVNACDDS